MISKNIGDKKSILRVAILVIFIFLVNTLALKFYWYHSVWHFDMFMHFLGGVWLGFLYVYLFKVQKQEVSLLLISKVCLFVFVIGFGWEMFEVFSDRLLSHNWFNLIDSISDLFFDMAGGLSVLYYIKIGR